MDTHALSPDVLDSTAAISTVGPDGQESPGITRPFTREEAEREFVALRADLTAAAADPVIDLYQQAQAADEEVSRSVDIEHALFYALPDEHRNAALANPWSDIRRQSRVTGEAQDRADEIYRQMAATEATTVAGIAIKLELAFDGCGEFCINFDDENSLEAALLASALADARRLSAN